MLRRHFILNASTAMIIMFSKCHLPGDRDMKLECDIGS